MERKPTVARLNNLDRHSWNQQHKCYNKLYTSIKQKEIPHSKAQDSNTITFHYVQYIIVYASNSQSIDEGKHYIHGT